MEVSRDRTVLSPSLGTEARVTAKEQERDCADCFGHESVVARRAGQMEEGCLVVKRMTVRDFDGGLTSNWVTEGRAGSGGAL